MFGRLGEVKDRAGFSGVFAADLWAVSDGDGPFRAQSFKILSRSSLHAKSPVSERGAVWSLTRISPRHASPTLAGRRLAQRSWGRWHLTLCSKVPFEVRLEFITATHHQRRSRFLALSGAHTRVSRTVRSSTPSSNWTSVRWVILRRFSWATVGCRSSMHDWPSQCARSVPTARLACRERPVSGCLVVVQVQSVRFDRSWRAPVQ